MSTERRSKVVALLAAGIAIGVVLAASPAGAHVGGTVNHLWNHLRPKADARYLPGQNLPRGKTMRGTFMIGHTATAGGQFDEDGYTFPRPLAARPIVHYILAGGAPTPQCPGSDVNPRAARGHLCLYENGRANVAGLTISNPTNNNQPDSSRWGFYIQISSTAAGIFWADGTWAVTAP